MTLLEETEDDIFTFGHKIADIDYITIYNQENKKTENFTWTMFKEWSTSYHLSQILPDIYIVFLDGSWMECHEYDGEQWWVNRKKPSKGCLRVIKKEQ